MTEPCRFQVSTSGSFAVDRVCAVHDAECAPVCDIGLAALRAENERLRTWPSDVMATLEGENAALRAKLEAIAAWSPVSARPCPLCTYQDGKFLAPCAWHRETGEQARVIAGIRELWIDRDGRRDNHTEEGQSCPGCDWDTAMLEALSPKEA